MARRTLHHIPAWRQSQAQVEAFGIDRFQLPSPAIGATHAVATREAGHARQRHRLLIHGQSWMNRGGTLAASKGPHKGRKARHNCATLRVRAHLLLSRLRRAWYGAPARTRVPDVPGEQALAYPRRPALISAHARLRVSARH